MARTFTISGRRRNIPKPVYLPEARASGDAVGHILLTQYGEQPWIHQIVEAVMAAVDRGVQQLGGSAGPQQNAMPGDLQTRGYVMPARSSQEVLQADPSIANRPSDIRAPTTQTQIDEGLKALDSGDFSRYQQVAKPADPSIEGHDEGTSSGHGDNSVSWLL